MHPYHLNIPIKPYAKSIDFNDNILFMGSCFSEHISHKLTHLQFNVFGNPNGIIFNPISLANPLIRHFKEDVYNENDLIENNGNWYSIHHHGKIFNVLKGALLNQINTQQKEFEQKLSTAQWLFITFGSAWVYTLKSIDIIVANCHKIPQSHFEKRLLSTEEITTLWEPILEKLKNTYPTLNVVFTVSPVKHLRDGVHENNLSKGTLLLAIHKLLSNHVSYFPAYELVTDDLRDYRFYEADSAHPNTMAIDYVFDKFKTTFFSSITYNTCDEIIKYLQLKNHTPISLEGKEYEQYLMAKELQLKKVQTLIPWFK